MSACTRIEQHYQEYTHVLLTLCTRSWQLQYNHKSEEMSTPSRPMHQWKDTHTANVLLMCLP